MREEKRQDEKILEWGDLEESEFVEGQKISQQRRRKTVGVTSN